MDTNRATRQNYTEIMLIHTIILTLWPKTGDFIDRLTNTNSHLMTPAVPHGQLIIGVLIPANMLGKRIMSGESKLYVYWILHSTI